MAERDAGEIKHGYVFSMYDMHDRQRSISSATECRQPKCLRFYFMSYDFHFRFFFLTLKNHLFHFQLLMRVQIENLRRRLTSFLLFFLCFYSVFTFDLTLFSARVCSVFSVTLCAAHESTCVCMCARFISVVDDASRTEHRLVNSVSRYLPTQPFGRYFCHFFFESVFLGTNAWQSDENTMHDKIIIIS